MPTFSYDALIIGSGQAGNPLATALADAGRRVVLVEENHLGGSCVNYGCSPTKALLAAAERAHHIRTAAEYGIRAQEPEVDFPAIIARKEALVQHSRAGVRSNLTQEHPGITVLHGHAAFTGPHSVRVTLVEGDEREIEAPLIFINTGTRPAIPPLAGLEAVPYLTTTELLDLQELPEHLLILGGGYIGMEFGQMFRRFGSRVTIIESGKKLLEREDDDVCAAMQEVLAAEGVELVLGAEARRVSRNAAGQLTISAHTPAGERRLHGSHLLIATGRTPNSDKLDLSKAGIKTDEKGYIRVNSSLETNVRGIYALGDVHAGPQFTHLSYDDYRVVRDALLHGKRRSARQRPLPYTVFTDPQLGRIGLSEEQAQAQKIPYRVAKMPVRTIGRARETGRTTGFWKVLVDSQDRILGAAIFCAEGGELMTMFQLIMMGRLKYPQLQNMIIAHPTWAEGINNVFAKLQEPE
ncbi:Pyruvate/2-oxoglutarate dehydrogenase complex, dihydrolipoamide dehydrogenase (E3) component [Hymenobacter daecheongensis DSM 21074]|uniref:Pyruvate/2-oxoglutarate dehydrogenase complex, dihydrolipoamide dehydrogenase (E3) component n=1 Tax=Hymenobacter daecheongensis DSM 21074 TaxID=1121955 RepID=A0A1M6GW34_9BACT|nr:mercuric reductase [Hymenobacter daecheongensis]SHJ14114.1 Pyruvate/2-oxoglutarate dehydrogenase complex, dihydrolipoamide dehydrogenase (E3) component [Hymenobacter daecheongensis DSM 21074]